MLASAYFPGYNEARKHALTPDLNDKFIEGALSGFEIKPKKQPQPGETHAIDRSQLQFSTELIKNAYQWETIQSFYENKQKTIQDTILDDSVKKAREDLLNALNLDIEKIDLSKTIADDFLVSPKIGSLVK